MLQQSVVRQHTHPLLLVIGSDGVLSQSGVFRLPCNYMIMTCFLMCNEEKHIMTQVAKDFPVSSMYSTEVSYMCVSCSLCVSGAKKNHALWASTRSEAEATIVEFSTVLNPHYDGGGGNTTLLKWERFTNVTASTPQHCGVYATEMPRQ